MSNRKVLLYAKCIDGTIHPYNPEMAVEILREFDNKDIVVSVTPDSPTRNLRQNNAYWGVAVAAIRRWLKEMTGDVWSAEEIHDYNLQHVIKANRHVKEFDGKTVIIYDIPRSSEVTIEQFATFYQEVQRYWTEKGCIVPDPISFLNTKTVNE